MKQYCPKMFKVIMVMVIALGSLFTMLMAVPSLSMAAGGTGGLEGIISKTVFKVVLPVIPEINVEDGKSSNTVYDFILDPLGLEAEKNQDPDKTFEPKATLLFKNEEDGAPYDYSHTSDALVVKSKSTMDVDVELTSTLLGMGNIRLTSNGEFVNDRTASVYLATMDSKGKISAIDKYGSFLKATLKGSPDAYKVIYDHSQKKYAYVLKNDDELSADNVKFADYTFRLTGACNTANSWSNLGNPSPNITVTWKVSPRPDNMAPSIGKTSYTMEKNSPVAIEIDLGSGNLAASNIKSITYMKTSGVTSLPAENYVFKNGTLSIGSSYISSVVRAGIIKRDYTITFNDSAQTQKVVTLLADNVSAPSIEQKEYDMVLDKDIQISVDLGSGESEATGIRSITYEKTSGTATLSADHYTFANGVLRLKASYINTVIRSGITSREYTITFDNKIGTQEKIKLTAGGAIPTISQTSYVMKKGEGVRIENIDLGSGYLAAQGIETITYMKQSGLAELPSENYNFDNGVLTIAPTYITSVINAGIVSRDYTVIFSNPAKTQVTITLNAEDVAPSVKNKKDSYDMQMGQDISIEVDLGSGDLRATGIQAIQYQKTSGIANLASENYVFSDGLLKIKGSYISSMINAGITTRDYTIIFNNSVQTSEKATFTASGALPTVTQTSYNMQRGSDVTIGINLGSGYLGATGTGIESIIYSKSSGLTTLESGKYTCANGNLVISATYINSVIDAGIKERDYTITFNNVAKTKITVKLIAKNIVPTVEKTSYSMIKGKDVLIGVDLGSGESGATGIQAIEYQKSSGTTNLAVENYSLSNGVLTMKSSYISSVLGAGVIERDYTIIFNDKDKTRKTVKLAVNGSVPSIATASYIMRRGQDIRININEGSLDLKGTVGTITYMKASGLANLPVANYSYSNGILVIKGSYITEVINAGIKTRDYTVNFNNVVNTKIKVTLTAEDVAPSIGTLSYKMSSGRPVVINIDLGSGNLMATGIRSITYTKASGVTTLASDNYMFSNGVLTIKSSYIDTVIQAGITSREYKVVFNDRNQTSKTLTFSK